MIQSNLLRTFKRLMAGLLLLAAAQFVVAVGMAVGGVSRKVLAGQWGLACFCVVLVANTAFVIRHFTLDGSTLPGWMRAVVSRVSPWLYMLFSGLSAACWAYPAWLALTESKGILRTSFGVLPCVMATALVFMGWRIGRADSVSAPSKHSGNVVA